MTPPRLTDEPGALALAKRIKAGELTALEATEQAIARIESTDGALNAVVVRDFERAREAARALDEAGLGEDQPLFGVPMTIKDSIDVAGLPSTWGLEAAKGNIAQRDAVVVQRVRAAGAVILGKTNVPPLLADWQSANPLYGITNNPHDTSRVPGGSSGGAAAAVASGMVPIEIGSDIGGSVRVPAHFCGIYGHKSTYASVPCEGQHVPGLDGADPALGVVGPLARNTDDLAVLFDLISDPVLPLSGKRLSDMRFLLVDTQPIAQVESAITDAMGELADRLRTAGAQVDHESPALPDLEAQHRDYMRMLGITMSGGAPGPDGKQASVRDWFDLCDAQARNQRQWRDLFATYDHVLAPPAGITAFPHDPKPGMAGRMIAINGEETVFADQLAWAGLASFPGLPSTAAPIAADDAGLPIGVQIMGDRLRDRDCIAAAGMIGALFGDAA
ncbi:amidase family protein [Alterisphingorhabdus coralli]|uniref:Amidase family protein n=1 Tax=Alterisphingorhabdus coralli TaxID=3071408 RepID=A0AA97I112_9SPHN|nr:amidase family protein [Parasphingorhabdus sp. SCSIO 66989]WOE76249.1 amidase family protein [Parasphingorhabdus sp. SCSIO 66989]